MKYDVDTYHDLARPFFGVTLLTPRDRFHTEVDFYTCGPLIATDVTFSDQRQERNTARMKQFNTEIVLLETYTDGSSRGLLDEHATLVAPGVIHLMDWSRPYVGIAREAKGIGLLIPHGELGYDRSVHPPYLSMGSETASGRLLTITLELLVAELRRGAQAEAERIAPALLGLVRDLMLGQAGRTAQPNERPGRRAIVEHYIRTNLRAPDLTADRICQDLGMSRATLYRVFGSGGVDRFIVDLRLEMCLNDLLRVDGRRGAVRRVAETWGFFDPGNFRRSFRARFGFSPSDAVGQAIIAAGHGRAVHPVHSLLRRSD